MKQLSILKCQRKENNFVVCCCFIIKLSNPSTFAKYKKQKQLFCSFIIQMSSLYCLLFCNQNVHCPRRQLATLSLGREKERARSSVRMKNGLQWQTKMALAAKLAATKQQNWRQHFLPLALRMKNGVQWQKNCIGSKVGSTTDSNTFCQWNWNIAPFSSFFRWTWSSSLKTKLLRSLKKKCWKGWKINKRFKK